MSFFSDGSEPKRDFSNANVFSKSDMSKNFIFEIERVVFFLESKSNAL